MLPSIRRKNFDSRPICARKKFSAQSNGFEAPTKFPAKRDSLIFTLAKKDLFAIINYGFNSYQDSYNFLANSLYIYDVLTCSSLKTDYYP